MLKIFHLRVDKDNHEGLLDAYLDSFPRNFQDAVLSFIRWQDAQLKLLDSLLLVDVLKIEGVNFYDLEIKFNKYGRPYFEDSKFKFNISHSGDIVMCVILDIYEVGVDIEPITDITLPDFEGQMTENEYEFVYYSKEPNKAFFPIKVG